MKSLIKKSIFIFLLIFLIPSFCSCSFFDSIGDVFSKINDNALGLTSKAGIEETDPDKYIHLDESGFNYSQYYENIVCRKSYDHLKDEGEKELYNELLTSIYYVYPEAEATYQYKTKQIVLDGIFLSEAQVRTAIKALTDDNPQIFWTSNTFGYLLSEDNNYTAIQLYSFYSPNEIKTRIAQLNKAVDDFFARVPSGLSEYELEKYVHDEIIDMCDYDKTVIESKGKESDYNIYNPYGVMVKNSAVCEGYSRTMQLLLNGLGVNCIGVMGGSHNELHMWNAVEIDGSWYYVDSTWDDVEKAFMRYNYFNISTEQLEKDHDFSPLFTEMTDSEICGDKEISASSMNIFIPKCNEVKYNYYYKECPHFYSFDDYSDIEDAVLNAAENSKEYIHIYIDKSLGFDDTVDLLFYSDPYYFFGYIREVNDRLSDYSIDDSNLSIYKNENLSIVTIFLKYI